MADSGKITDKAAELAGQAAAAAGPLKDKATELAGRGAAAAGPIVGQGRTKAAQGVDVLAENLDKITGGKYSGQIHSVADKVGGKLDTNKAKPVTTTAPTSTSGPTDPAPLATEPAPLATEPAPVATGPTPVPTEPAPLPTEPTVSSEPTPLAQPAEDQNPA